jgi:hypothetical protein
MISSCKVMLDSSADLKRPNVWFNGPKALGSAAATLNAKECRHQVECGKTMQLNRGRIQAGA